MVTKARYERRKLNMEQAIKDTELYHDPVLLADNSVVRRKPGPSAIDVLLLAAWNKGDFSTLLTMLNGQAEINIDLRRKVLMLEAAVLSLQEKLNGQT